MAESAPSTSKRWPKLFPDADLLKQVEGVEQGLRQRRRLGRVGWAGLVASGALQIGVTVLDSDWLRALRAADWNTLLQQWRLLLPLVAVALFVLLYGWSRFWLKASQEPFRYTCSIADFTAVKGTTEEPKLSWLVYDLAQRLNQRVGRLRFLDDKNLKTDTTETESHIHVRGAYVVREDRARALTLDVSASVRIGGPRQPETMGHAVVCALKNPGGLAPAAPGSRMSVDEYEQLVERVYFSAATEIYRQIRDDVASKIALLPTSYFRAMAFFHEARDYARSNTLDAYEDARQLYHQAALLLDPALAPLPDGRIRRWLRYRTRRRFPVYRWMRRQLASVFPRVGEREVLCARAEVGYATMLIYRMVLAGISGQRTNPIFEAPPVLERAMGRLQHLSPDVLDRNTVLFDARVIMALAMAYLGSAHRAKAQLADARRLDPARAEQDARYLFASGVVAGDARSSATAFRRAVELQPRFEVAHFSLALALEDLWRSRPTFERGVADDVLQEYGEIIKTNPGSIGAWANRGYIRWLLVPDAGDARERAAAAAEQEFMNGRDYKAIKRETFVAELDYGLARIAAERGDFERAYTHYAQVIATQFVPGANYTSYYFGMVGDAMLERFERYRRTVESAWRQQREAETPRGRHRVLDVVYAFVLNDYGEACVRYADRVGDAEARRRAHAVFDEAVRHDPANPMPHFNLAHLEPSAADHHLGRALAVEPDWPPALLRRASLYGERMQSVGRRAREILKRAEENRQAADAKESTANARRVARIGVTSMGSRGAAAGGPGPPAVDTGAPSLVDSLEDEVRRHRLKAKAQEEESKRLQREAREADEEARALFRRLLPHAWLWQAEGGSPTFHWRALDRDDYVDELKWERDLTDLHAEALCTWAEALVLATANDNANAEVNHRQATRLLAHTRRHFWPDRFASIMAERHASPGGALSPQDTETLRAMIEQWWLQDPAGLQSLYGFEDPVFGADERKQRLLRLADRPDWSAVALRWLAEQFVALEEREAARTAYLRARRTVRDPELALAIGDGLEQVEGWADALDLYTTALGWPTEPAIKVSLRIRRAATLWSLGRRAEALTLLDDLGAATGVDPDWRAGFIRLLVPRTPDEPGRQQLTRWLEAERRRARTAGDDATLRDVRKSLLTLVRVRAPAADADPQPSPLLATPIVLEADGRLFPADEKVMEAHELTKDLLPAMRERISRETGVRVPGVRVRANNDLAPGTYVIQINEVPAAPGAIDPTRVFCPSPVGLTGDDVSPALNPLTGETTGAWVAATRESKLRASGREVWTHWAYMTRHLERIVRAALPTFFGLQELSNALDDWCGASGPDETEQYRRRHLVAQVLPDTSARIRLLGVLHELLGESIPITNFDMLLDAFRREAPRHGEPTDLVEAIRATLPPAASRNTDRVKLLGLAPAFEAAIQQALIASDGRRVLALPYQTAQALLAAVERSLDGIDDAAAIVTRQPGLRPYVSRLLAVRFSRVSVVGDRELPRPVRQRVTTLVPYP